MEASCEQVCLAIGVAHLVPPPLSRERLFLSAECLSPIWQGDMTSLFGFFYYFNSTRLLFPLLGFHLRR